MILIIEIMLTVSAFKKGWGWKALIPWMILFPATFILGAVMGVNGVSEDSQLVLGLLLDGVLIISMLIMNASAPKDRIAGRKTKNNEIPIEVLTSNPTSSSQTVM